MLTHIVLFKLKDRSPESVARTAQVLRNMDGAIEEIQSIAVGTDIVHTERSYDIALVTTFASLEAMQAYQVHPEHQKVIAHMAEARESQAVVDYES